MAFRHLESLVLLSAKTDFVCPILADPNERQYQDGRDATNVPSTPEALEAAFKASEIHARMVAEREAFKNEIAAEQSRRADFEQAVQTDKHRAVGKKSPYTVSFFTQVQALVIRQFQLKMQDRFDLVVSFATSIIVAIISGSVYLQMPQTSAGAFTRGGAVSQPSCALRRLARRADPFSASRSSSPSSSTRFKPSTNCLRR